MYFRSCCICAVLLFLLSCGDDDDGFPCLDLSDGTDCMETADFSPTEVYDLLLGSWRASSSAFITIAGSGEVSCPGDEDSARRITFLADSTYVITVGGLSDTVRWTVLGPTPSGFGRTSVVLGDRSSGSFVDAFCPSDDLMRTCEGCNPDAGVVTVWIRQ